MKRKLISLLFAAILPISLCLSAMAAETEPVDSANFYGDPWLTSIVDGMVTENLKKPDLKEDFYLNNNYEWLCDTALKPNHAQAGGIFDLSDMVEERVVSLFTDESISGRGAEMVREYFQMNLDWESRAKGREFFLEHLKPIQEIATLEDMTREDEAVMMNCFKKMAA